MWTKTKGAKNISNYFSIVDDIGKAFEQIMNADTEGLFGLELQLYPGGRSLVLVSPPSLRIGNGISPRQTLVEGDTEDLSYYEGYLLEPNFLPLYGAYKGALLNELSSIELKGGEIIELQWLLRRRYDNWRPNAVARYGSYLEGNDYPMQSKLGRGLQTKILKTLNKIASFETKRPYIQEVENKIVDEAYQFQLRVVVRSKEPKSLVQCLDNVLSKYDSYNALRLYKRKERGIKQEYTDRIMTGDTDTQILSRTELVSLFGGTAIEVTPVQPAVTEKQLTDYKVTEVKTDGIIALLPKYDREKVEADEGLITKLAEAMKRVGLISQARLTNSTITSGIRLTVIQCDIPKQKTLSHIIGKAVDIQAALGVVSLSVEQGSTADTVRFTIPNEVPSIIGLRELLEDARFHEYAQDAVLPFIVGVNEIDEPIYLSLGKLVHLMVAGTTGSGKSVFVNTLIISLLATYPPELLRFYMIDPKLVELSHYKDLPHVEHVVTDMEKASAMLSKLVKEMERRYSQFSENGVKGIKVYNEKMDVKMPYIVCVVDEYADLRDTNPEVEEYLVRLGQKARAAGIHLVIATQRPSSTVISGRVKAVIPSAISFNLNSNTDYKTVFGKGIGSTKLLGRGDGIMRIEGWEKEFQRFQSSIVSPVESREEQVYKDIINYYSDVKTIPLDVQKPVIEEVISFDGNIELEEDIELDYDIITEEDLLEKLKGVIARTRETRVAELRKLMKIKMNVLSDLMNKLVEEGWLVKHPSRAKGYEISIDELTLARYKK
ncbi:FtsK_SpoIIIE-family protein [Bacillus phage vB_BceM_Bc431v3]|uniref:FtsK_SpoIIIE-family protein n=1 Tax=Bacillus phage vB_BceM_Bc431v3 TaxID=1195072 RepID=M4HPA2_9CAUD|nr:FtsK/SpoIIIE-like protein [Bacillus phage vB_BceM_Bc431v3]AFQ96407.1 FtsK_SpoIIIE-family protein [Bacillus phage vB_BceM_Bc431v3]